MSRIDFNDQKQTELSDEDEQLKNELTMLVERLQEPNELLFIPSLSLMKDMIRASTTSMTAVPKPLKFMQPYYKTMLEIYKKLPDQQTREACADVISVLAMTMGSGKECLVYRLLCDPKQSIGDWGHDYVRHLSGEIAKYWTKTSQDFQHRLIGLVKEIIPYNMGHNAEADACDLLMEIQRLDLLEAYVEESSYPRVYLYLQSCVPYVPASDNTVILEVLFRLSMKFECAIEAMRSALVLNDATLIQEVFQTHTDPGVKKQLAFLLARQQIPLELEEINLDDYNLYDILSNIQLSQHFISLARELDILDPKIPEDVFKSKLDSVKMPNSAKQNLAASFVNGFLNAGFCNDTLLSEDGGKWLYRNKDCGMLSATASLGLIYLWNIDSGLTLIDKYLYSNEENIKAGALLACGILNSGIRSEIEPAHALLYDYINQGSTIIRKCAILGLGIAYAGTNRITVIDSLRMAFVTNNTDLEILSVVSLSLGLVAVSSCNAEIAELQVQAIINCSEADSSSPCMNFLVLGLCLLYLGRRNSVEAILPALNALREPFNKIVTTMAEICAYAGSGDVLKIQELLHLCHEHYVTPPVRDLETNSQSTPPVEVNKYLLDMQSVAVVGIGLIAMGEEIGSEMVVRSLGNLMRYCESNIRKAVPLALALVSVSNPRPNIMEILSKFSHDADPEVAHNAIFAMGLIGAGTNHARLAAMLRQLAQYYSKDAQNLFIVRIAQGLTHLGKGTLSLSPFHSDRQLMNPVAVAGLVATVVAFLDIKSLIFDGSHYFLYLLAPAIHPRMLMTLDEDLNQLHVPVRVGMAVDIVGQAGKPKTITSFQTHTTPVLLSIGERAELATEEYVPLTPILEGFVMLRKNPEFKK